MNPESIGKALIGIGLGVSVLGVLVYFFGSKGLSIGRLPGDLSFEGEQFKFYFPLTTLLLVNGLIWVILKLIAWFSK